MVSGVQSGLALTLRGGMAAPGGGAMASAETPSALHLLFSGLRAGLLTFGGAYTAIPFVQRDAVAVGGWMSNAQFLDGLALSGILPAFAFTLIGHDLMERVVERPGVHAALHGVAAGVVGLIAATALQLLPATITDLPRAAIFLVALAVTYRWKAKWGVLVIVGGAGLLGLMLLC
jgi:chromate transporter